MLKGSTEPRVFTPPLRELTPDTTLGYDVCEFARDVLGLSLYPWEEWLFVHALEVVGDLGGDWHFRFRTVLVLIARQNGKSMMGQVLSLFFLYALQVQLVIGTAQSLDQAEEVWEGAVAMATDNEALARCIEQVYRGNGSKLLKLQANRRYMVKAATRKGTRGKSGDLVLLDELREHQSWAAWSAVTKTTMARPDALVWCMSNAGDGTSVVLRHLRNIAHAAIGDPDGICTGANAVADAEEVDDSLGLFEWSADPALPVDDREGWRQANPSLGYGMVTERALRSACATDPADEFKTECLCQWVTATVDPPFPVGAWDAGRDESSEIAPDSALWWGVDVSADRSQASVCVCGLTARREWHVELAAYRPGIAWLATWFADRAAASPMKVALQARGAPVSSMAEVLAAIDGVEVVPCQGPDVAGWAGRFWDAVSACDPPEDQEEHAVPVRHRTQGALDLAANIAATRPLGDGAWTWDRNRSLEDISPIVAATMAHGAATAVDRAYESAYEDEAHSLLCV